jgi:hypothetical protein
MYKRDNYICEYIHENLTFNVIKKIGSLIILLPLFPISHYTTRIYSYLLSLCYFYLCISLLIFYDFSVFSISMSIGHSE